MIEIGKKAPKFRRSPQRSKEWLPAKRNVSTAQHGPGRRDSVSSSGSKDHDDVTDKATKHVGKQVRWRRTAWDDDWHTIDEQLRVVAREMDMEVIRSELATQETKLRAFNSPCRNAGQHYEHAQARSFKPSVKARASKLKKRHRRRQKTRVEFEKKKDCCLVRAFRSLGIKVPYVHDGPFWVLKDGLEMLRPRGYIVKPVARICSDSLGQWVFCRDGHCIALRRYGEDDTWSIDGTDRKRVAEKDVETLVNGAKLFQVPHRRS